MNILNKCHALVTAAVLCSLATQANVASADTVICDADWPQHVRTCNSASSGIRAEGNSLNTASNKVLVQAFLFQGRITEAIALNAQGISICNVSTTVVNGLGAGKECTVTTPATRFRVISRNN
jgi:hypothetical protein